jgi:hypothetical protein
MGFWGIGQTEKEKFVKSKSGRTAIIVCRQLDRLGEAPYVAYTEGMRPMQGEDHRWKDYAMQLHEDYWGKLTGGLGLLPPGGGPIRVSLDIDAEPRGISVVQEQRKMRMKIRRRRP